MMLLDACFVLVGDEDIPVCIDMDDNSWDEFIKLQLQKPTENSKPEEDAERDEIEDQWN